MYEAYAQILHPYFVKEKDSEQCQTSEFLEWLKQKLIADDSWSAFHYA